MSDNISEKNADKVSENMQKKMRAVRVVGNGRGGRIVAAVTEVVTPIAEELGYIVWDVEYVKEGADYILRITIDKDGGITIDDCEKFTRAVDEPLDRADPIENAYMLEVSSPGVERSLSRAEHFEYCIGEKVEIKLFAPMDNCKVFTGVLIKYDCDGTVHLDVGGVDRAIPRDAIAKARTLFDF